MPTVIGTILFKQVLRFLTTLLRFKRFIMGESNCSDAGSSNLECSRSLDCPYIANLSERCPLYSAVLQHSNLEHLEINREAEAEPSWLHNDNTILLHSAIEDNNLDALCSMLYYGVNFNTTNHYPFEPMLYPIWREYVEVTKIMINFYDDLYFLESLQVRNSILFYLLLNCDVYLFKVLLRKMDPSNCNQMNYLLILFVAFEYRRWTTSDWLECIYLILNNVNNPPCEISLGNCLSVQSSNFMNDLFTRFSEKNVQRKDRLKIINICLSLGIPVVILDFDFIYHHYGFGDEFEALIYGSHMPHYILSFFNINRVIKQIAEVQSGYFLMAELLLGLYRGRFYLPVENKKCIKRKLIKDTVEQLLKEIEHMPKCPTLLELCRNQVRKMIWGSVRYPYHFHDTVKQLELPCILIDIVRLKPIYR